LQTQKPSASRLNATEGFLKKTVNLTEGFLKNRLNLTEGFLKNRLTETQYHFWLTVCEPGESRAHRRWQHLASEEVASSRHSEIKSYSENHIVRQLSENHTQTQTHQIVTQKIKLRKS
jgi:hypothetical protein